MSQMVEQADSNSLVIGSIPIISANIPEWTKWNSNSYNVRFENTEDAALFKLVFL